MSLLEKAMFLQVQRNLSPNIFIEAEIKCVYVKVSIALPPTNNGIPQGS
jgi:hypothetical protein